MIIALQFPIADARNFLNRSTGRLRTPTWPFPKQETDFVRNFGIVHVRRSSGDSLSRYLKDDHYYSSAASAIKFHNFNKCNVGLPDSAIFPKCIFRRLFCDGVATTRVEIGLTAYSYDAIADKNIMMILKNVLGLQTKVNQYLGSSQCNSLQLQGPALARSYLYATTETNAINTHIINNHYISACEPMLIIEYISNSEISSLPSKFKVIDPSSVNGLSLAYTRLFSPNERQSIGIWFIGRDQMQKDIARKLRLCLFRLHAERQILGQVIRWVSKGTIQYEPNTEAGELLSKYINEATRIIGKEKKYNFNQDLFINILAAYEWLISPEEKEILEETFEGIHGQILTKLKNFSNQQKYEKQDIYIYMQNNIEEGGQFNMSSGQQHNVSISYGNNNIFNGDVIAAENIKNSFNTANKTSQIEVADVLKKLTDEIAKLCEKLDNDKQQEVSRKLKAFTEEAVASKPDKSFLKVTGNGLIEAAKTVADMSAPIISTVTKILTLFGITV